MYGQFPCNCILWQYVTVVCPIWRCNPPNQNIPSSRVLYNIIIVVVVVVHVIIIYLIFYIYCCCTITRNSKDFVCLIHWRNSKDSYYCSCVYWKVNQLLMILPNRIRDNNSLTGSRLFFPQYACIITVICLGPKLTILRSLHLRYEQTACHILLAK